MRSLALLLLSAMFVLLLGFPALAGEKMLVHFVVVVSSDDVTESDFKGLKDIFLKHAGGYTEMPSTVGSSMQGGKATPEEVNTSFLVAGKQDISREIKEYIQSNKHFREPFVLVWEAQRQ